MVVARGDDSELGRTGAPPAVAPHDVRLVASAHRWERFTFLHWPMEPAQLAKVVPEPLRVLTYDGDAWVGLTPFLIRVRPPGLPFTPPGCSFPETNLRTYVVGPDGREGLWFIRMEVTALWFVAALRVLGLPYFHHRMRIEGGSHERVYRSLPLPWSRGGGHHVVVRPGARLDSPAGGPRDRFLTARWGAFHRRGPLLLHTPVEHEPWSLHSAQVEQCEVGDLFDAAGLPSPKAPPIAHYSPGVSVRVGLARPVV